MQILDSSKPVEGGVDGDAYHDDDYHGESPPHNLRLSGQGHRADPSTDTEPHHLPVEPAKSFLAALDMMLSKENDAKEKNEAMAGPDSTELDAGYQGSPEHFADSTSPTNDDDDEAFMWDYEEMTPTTSRLAWDCRGMVRVQIRHYLDSIILNGEVGDFIIRDRKTEPGTYALQIKASADQYTTQAIDRTTIGGRDWYHLRLPGVAKFTSLRQLVRHYALRPREELGYLQLRYTTAVLPSHATSPDRISMMRSISRDYPVV